MKSGSLNLLEPSGPHRACYGTPVPFTFTRGCTNPGVPGRPGDSHAYKYAYQFTCTIEVLQVTTAFVGPEYETCFMVPLWHIESGGGTYVSGKHVVPCLNTF